MSASAAATSGQQKPPPPAGPPPSRRAGSAGKRRGKGGGTKTVSSRLPIPDGTTHLITKATASYVPGNLSTDGQRFAYASGSHPVLVSYTNDSLARGSGVTSKGAYPEASPVVAAVMCPVSFGTVLAVANEEGALMVYDTAGQRFIDSETSCAGAGITSVASDGSSRLYVGRRSGGVTVARVNEASVFADRTLAGVDRPVLALAAHGSTVACGLDDGAVVLLDASGGTEESPGRVVAVCETSPHPITAVVYCGPNVVAGNSAGRLFVLCGSTGRKLAEISAHTRPVNALAVHPSRLEVASVSEDTWVHVWSVPKKADNIQCPVSRRVESSVLTGVTFCGRQGDTLAVTAYDSGTIRLMPARGNH